MVRAAALVALALLAGCDRPDESVCLTPRAPIATPDTAEGWEGVAKHCIHRWSYRLARSRDPAETVAAAVMSGCQEPVSRYILEQDSERREALGDKFDRRVLSAKLGRVVPDVHSSYLRLRDDALFHVVQARAGNCKAD